MYWGASLRTCSVQSRPECTNVGKYKRCARTALCLWREVLRSNNEMIHYFSLNSVISVDRQLIKYLFCQGFFPTLIKYFFANTNFIRNKNFDRNQYIFKPTPSSSSSVLKAFWAKQNQSEIIKVLSLLPFKTQSINNLITKDRNNYRNSQFEYHAKTIQFNTIIIKNSSIQCRKYWWMSVSLIKFDRPGTVLFIILHK